MCTHAYIHTYSQTYMHTQNIHIYLKHTCTQASERVPNKQLKLPLITSLEFFKAMCRIWLSLRGLDLEQRGRLGIVCLWLCVLSGCHCGGSISSMGTVRGVARVCGCGCVACVRMCVCACVYVFHIPFLHVCVLTCVRRSHDSLLLWHIMCMCFIHEYPHQPEQELAVAISYYMYVHTCTHIRRSTGLAVAHSNDICIHT